MGVMLTMVSTMDTADLLPVKRARSSSPVLNHEDLAEDEANSQSIKRPSHRSLTGARQARHEQRKGEVLQYLTAIMKLRPDFDIYEKSKGHGFHGPTLLKIYKFAVDFMEKYKDQYTLTLKVCIKSRIY
jgi:hypothetical protein